MPHHWATYLTIMKTHYQRYLPHILPPGETIFITFRLHGSLPQAVVERLIDERRAVDKQLMQVDPAAREKARADNHKRQFARFDNCLDTCETGHHWLQEPAVARLVADAIKQPNGRNFTLHAYCIMSNHVHLLLTIETETKAFATVMQSLKGFTARKANELLNRTGQSFWQPVSYDHVVRSNQEFDRIVAYILNNPVKAGLIENWADWPYSYVVE